MEKISSIELNKSEIKTLRKIKHHKYGLIASSLNQEAANFLFSKGLLYYDDYKGNSLNAVYTIRPEGCDWLEFNRKSNKRFWIPIVISLVALLKSFLARYHFRSETINATMEIAKVTQ